MAVPEQTPYKEYTANGSVTSFALGFICDSKNDLIVLVDNVAPPVATWSLVGNNAVFTTAPASGKKIVLQRNTAMSRTTNYQGNNNSFRPETINKDIDRVWLKLQELGVADMLLKIYVDRLHGEQKDYIDNKDQLVRNIISDLRNYVNQQDAALAQSISNLRNYTDQQDNNRNSYFENLINQQGVSLQQLDNYYKHLLQGIANIAAEKGWLASLVTDKSGKNQQEVNLILGSSFFVEMWGAKGDGVTDDSAAIQSAINDLSAKFLATNQEQTLLFSGSKTYVCRGISLKAGVHYQGANGRARIKKVPAGDITDEAVLKWRRIFAVPQNEASFNSDAARKVRHRFANLIFDGNRDNMNWSGGYAQEQAASLFLTGNGSTLLTAADQRNKFQVDNCLFVNSVADGIGVWYNADVIINNEEAIDCFRGGLVASGGNTIIFVNGYVSTKARIDFEVDSAGYGGSHKLNWNLNNIECDKNNPNPAGMVGADLCVADGGIGVGNNLKIYSTPVNFNGRGVVASNPNTRLEFNNSTFTIATDGSSNYIYPCDTDFNNVRFIAKNSANTEKSGLRISWGVGNAAVTGKRIRFNKGCTFVLGDGISSDTLDAAVRSYRVNTNPVDNTIEFNDANILAVYQYAVRTDGLISVEWNSGKIAAVTAFYSIYAANAPFRLSIGNYESLPTNINMLATNVTNGTGTENKLTFKNTVLDKSKSNVIVFSGGSNSGRVDKKIGNRVILSDTPPVAAMSAYNGDVLRLNTVPVSGPYEWVCTTANFSNITNTWKPIKWNVGSFTTDNLPSLTAFDVGVQNIDLTLNKLVAWSGTAWV